MTSLAYTPVADDQRGKQHAGTKRIFLLCNAHLDPTWLWEWEEGAAAAISTFRTAADLLEEYDGFVFNHNEVILYEWVEEYEPELFKRIQRLVKQGKWNIMGGWFLQPDCNMPSGEGFVRQALVGKRYFKDKFGVDVSTAINFDPFGHTRGLVQILAKSGSDSYLFCRPDQNDCPLPASDFIWVGFDGSEVMGSRVVGFYNSRFGKAREKVEERMRTHPERDFSLLLWGVGDHGGGPSRHDLTQITKLIQEAKDSELGKFDIIHSTPQAYFAELAKTKSELPRREDDVNRWATGCYTSQIRIKQKHRELENTLFMTEKMCTIAAGQNLMAYPQEELAEAQRDLLTSQFHDILPGSSIQPVEESSIRMMDHGLEILSRVRARAFFALSSGQPVGKDGELPVLVFNPHPFKIRTIVECEFQVEDHKWDGKWSEPIVYQPGKDIASQSEKELSNINLDWRKRVAFEAELQPASMNRFDCKFKMMKERPKPKLKPRGDAIRFKNDTIEVVINTRTGFVDRYRVNGVDQVEKNAFQPIVVEDDADSWGMRKFKYNKVVGRFKLMPKKDAARISGSSDPKLPSVRVVEDGPARVVVEALFHYGDSFICQQYKLPRKGSEIGVSVRVYWLEKDRMLKLSIPTPGDENEYVGQTAYGVQDLPTDGTEAVAQKWTAVVDRDADRALTCINDSTYGSDYSKRGLRLTLLRSPAYSGHPIADRPITPNDRFVPRIDQGERLFSFWFNAGDVRERLDAIDREALVKNERPFALSFFPPGMGNKLKAGIKLSDKVVQVTTFKKAEAGNAVIVRLFEPTGRSRSTTLELPFAGVKTKVSLGGFELKTLKIDPKSGKVTETDLLEKSIRGR